MAARGAATGQVEFGDTSGQGGAPCRGILVPARWLVDPYASSPIKEIRSLVLHESVEFREHLVGLRSGVPLLGLLALLLPGVHPAGLGDFVTGAFGPFVGLAVARQRPHAIKWATAWNMFGLLDLIVAPAAAVLSQAQVIGLYPLSLVPLFIGPPLGILTHVYSLRNLAMLSSSAVSDASGQSRAERRGMAIEGAVRTT